MSRHSIRGKHDTSGLLLLPCWQQLLIKTSFSIIYNVVTVLSVPVNLDVKFKLKLLKRRSN
jgi:hypothetical protein